MSNTDTKHDAAPAAGAPRFEKGTTLVLAGLRKRYTFETMTEIPALWSAFGPRIGTIPAVVGAAAYGVITGTPDGTGFDYLAGVEVSETAALPSDLTTIAVPAQRYAVFSHPGSVATLCETIDHAFHQWLPTSGHELSGHPDFFERYGERYNPETGTGDIEIWIPIKG
jgi:AraC family transcriptional regulator